MMRVILVVCGFLLVAEVACAQTLESTEAKYLAGLRERRLFELAETYCKQKLAEAYLVRGRRAELTIELSRTALESALFAKPPEREARFAEAAATLDGARFDRADDPWRLPVAVQRGVVDLVQGELQCEEAQLLHTPEAALAAAREPLRSAVARLKKAREAIDEQLRTVHRAGAGAKLDEPTAGELASLKRNCEYQLARAYRNQGESYSEKSADRSTALDQAIAALEAVARSESNDALTWQARLDEVVCRRKLGDLDGAERMLDLIDKQSPPKEIADRARAQRVRIRLDAGAPDQAEELLRVELGDDPDLMLAAIEQLTASAREATKQNRAAEAAKRQGQAAQLARAVADRHSAYWAHRAESLVAAAVANAPAGDEQLLLRAAESLYAGGNSAAAVETYDKAFAQAKSAGDAATAFRAAYAAAAIEDRLGRYVAAHSRFVALAAALPEHPQAAEAHFAAIIAHAERVGLQTNAADSKTPRPKPERPDEAWLKQYRGLLQEQIRRWPEHATTVTAYYWLARTTADWPEAAALLKSIPADAPIAVEVVDFLAQGYARFLRQERAAGRPVSTLGVEQALARFAPGLPQPPADLQSPTVRAAVRAVAALWLELVDDRFAEANAIWDRLQATATSDDEKAVCENWLLVAEVGLGRIDEAQRRAAQLTVGLPSPQDRSAAVRLDELARRLPAERQVAVAEIILRACELRRDTTFDAAISAAQARAYVQLGRPAEARKHWDALMAQSPNDASLRIAYAEFLSTQPDRDAAQTALAQWREIERSVREGTAEWYRARLGVVRAYVQLGEKSRAAQLIELTTALHPDLGGPTTKAEFLRLAERCK